MTHDPDNKSHVFYYRQDDVLELHRLVRHHLSSVITDAVEKMKEGTVKRKGKEKKGAVDEGTSSDRTPPVKLLHLLGRVRESVLVDEIAVVNSGYEIAVPFY